MRILTAERRRLRAWLWEKTVNTANNFGAIVKLYVGSLILGGIAFSLLEEGRSLGDGLWWSVVTALTIGYGDLSPVTPAGRVVAACFQHFWAYGMIPLIAVNLLTHVVRDKDKYTHDEQEWTAESLRVIAAKLGAELPPSPTNHDN